MLKTLVKKLLLSTAFVFALPALAGSAENPHVLLQTSLGDIELELDATRAPLGVANFLAYVDSGFYDGTVFHRVIPGFMVQGGGFNQDMQQKPAQPPIKNESQNGLSNGRGSIAYARTASPHSATSQFYINLVDNPHLDARNGGPGYAVFGHVVRGMDVVDKIAQVPTEIRFGLPNVPQDNVLIVSAKRLEPLSVDGASLP